MKNSGGARMARRYAGGLRSRRTYGGHRLRAAMEAGANDGVLAPPRRWKRICAAVHPTFTDAASERRTIGDQCLWVGTDVVDGCCRHTGSAQSAGTLVRHTGAERRLIRWDTRKTAANSEYVGQRQRVKSAQAGMPVLLVSDSGRRAELIFIDPWGSLLILGAGQRPEDGLDRGQEPDEVIWR